MSRHLHEDLDTDLAFVAADGYAAMFEDAPPPTEDDLRDLQPSARAIEMRPSERAPAELRSEPLRIRSVA